MDDDAIRELITRRRRQFLVSSVAYYLFDASIVPDHVYDARANELIRLQRDYPHIAATCPYHDICAGLEHASGFYIHNWPDEIVSRALWYVRMMNNYTL